MFVYAWLPVAARVSILADAEQTYFQTAIDLLVRALQLRHNKHGAVVYNTFQCYLVNSR